MYVCVIIIDVGVSLQDVTSYVLSWIGWALEEQGGKKKRVGELGGPASCFFEVYTKWLYHSVQLILIMDVVLL